jgi:hypothetical protein
MYYYYNGVFNLFTYLNFCTMCIEKVFFKQIELNQICEIFSWKDICVLSVVHFNVSLRLPCLHFVTLALHWSTSVAFGPSDYWVWIWMVDCIKKGHCRLTCVVLLSQIFLDDLFWTVAYFILFIKCHEACCIWVMSWSMAENSIIKKSRRSSWSRFVMYSGTCAVSVFSSTVLQIHIGIYMCRNVEIFMFMKLSVFTKKTAFNVYFCIVYVF